MNDKKSSLLKSAMNGGVITGIILIFSFMFMLLFKFGNSIQFFFIIAVLGFCNYSIAKKYRDRELDGTISYEKSLGFGFLVSLFASIIVAFIVYAELSFMKPALMDQLFEVIKIQYEKMGYSKQQIDSVLQILNPLTISFMMILFFTFLGFISSLFSAMFVRKDGNTFNQSMKNIE